MFWPLTVSLLVTWSAGAESKLVLTQPAAESVSLGNTVRLPCVWSSSTSVSEYHMHWYQLKPGNRPRFLLWHYAELNNGKGSGVPSRFSGSKDTSSNTGYLTITRALAEDEADYYCGTGYNDKFHSDTIQ